MKAHTILLLAATIASPAAAQTAKNDYGDGKNWLCRPAAPTRVPSTSPRRSWRRTAR
jgi:hypothetical protein